MAQASLATDAGRVERWLRTVASTFPSRREAVIPLLQAAQGEFGYLPVQAMEGIARRLKIPAAEIQGIATFYAQFRFHPPGEHKVTICRGTACHVRGSGQLLDELSFSLGVRAGETTKDGAFTLETVACFGSCALAPVVVVDGKVYGRQTPAVAKKTLDRVRRERPSNGRGRGRARGGPRGRKGRG